MSGYIAGADLYKHGRVAYARGERVPGDAFPAHQVATMLANGGLRRASDPVEDDDTLAQMVHASTVEENARIIRGVTDPAELDLLHIAEQAHPRYPGGRFGVLDAIEERRGELAIETQDEG